jgi:isopropylmalate/homocitrate/citramalate synthase
MSVSQKLRWRRYLNKLRFVHEEIEIVEEISTKTGPDFQAYLESYCAKNNINLRSLNRDHSEKVEEAYKNLRWRKQKGNLLGDCEDEIEPDVLQFADENVSEENIEFEREDTEIHETFSKLFKKIALYLHPDRLPKNLTEQEVKQHIDIFNNAKQSLEERRYFILLDLAEKYGVSIPKNYKQQINWMKREIDSLESKLNSKKKTYNHLFAESESDEEKNDLVKRFIKQLFGI